jgi:membrane-bound metal-dependent hydrolase YbcI (DUF457 family)
LAGLAVYSVAPDINKHSRLKLMLLCITMAVFPDLDLLPGLLQGQPVLYHGSISHSLGFALGVSLVIALIFHFQGSAFGPIFKLCLIAYVSHLVLDFFGPDGRAPYGIPLFWPLSSAHFLSPIPLLLGARHVGSTTASTMAFLRGVLSFYNVAAMTLEIAIVAPFIWLGQRFRRANREG